MKYVKHKKADWIGIIDKEVCTSGLCVFDVTEDRRKQLMDHDPTEKEKSLLLKRLKDVSVYRNVERFIAFVEGNQK